VCPSFPCISQHPMLHLSDGASCMVNRG
jgi:hypothetical protein